MFRLSRGPNAHHCGIFERGNTPLPRTSGKRLRTPDPLKVSPLLGKQKARLGRAEPVLSLRPAIMSLLHNLLWLPVACYFQ